MVTKISPIPLSDGSGRDTYITLENDFRIGLRQAPANFSMGLRSPSPRLQPHQKGYQRWYHPSQRSKHYAPPVKSPVATLPSSLASSPGNTWRSSSTTPRKARPYEPMDLASDTPRLRAGSWVSSMRNWPTGK
eukprot:TRINITY_DN95639_c0_g1_i1.p1 TRINITY_DN95639_c0_g1~~TRINITY_DN95639_c0_g1_i1.p1  ORF type:complete len:154 (+),score=11.52 TRINITY_DN95639_c0_g1_i1:65-463(+)